ncbi:MAG: single-stranded DNA-binding protein [Proteobacteria bacterium]|nr:MAG: single-stranded DNA-binding protein [Pseudomonadota bacterium]
MAGVNFAVLIGNVGRDPELKMLNDGSRAARFSLATSETWKDKTTAERKERTEWHTIVAYAPALVEIIDKYVRKGSKLYIKAPIRTRKWTGGDGIERYTTEIVLSGFGAELVLLDKAGPGRPDIAAGDSYGASAPAPVAGGLDDEIPF